MKKRILSFLLALMVALAMIPVGFADGGNVCQKIEG